MINKINGNTKIYGIIGYPVKHSFSPKMQNAAFAELKMDAVYLPFLVKPEDISEAIDGIKALNMSGFNVTATDIDFICLGGTLIINRLISPSTTACKCSLMASICQLS